jgi:hypothetical protein
MKCCFFLWLFISLLRVTVNRGVPSASLHSYVNHFSTNTSPSFAYFTYPDIRSTTISSKMVNDFTSKTFPCFSQFSYLGIWSIIISNKMVSDLTSNQFPSASYFSYLGIWSTTISSEMVSFFILGLSVFLTNVGFIEHVRKNWGKSV